MYTRQSKFGWPPPRPPQSTVTTRLVPLTQGIRTDQPFTERPPGSATSLVNFIPADGKLIPRSRLSSLGTVPAPGRVYGMTEVAGVDGSVPQIWVSTSSRHGLINVFGDYSIASFVSADHFGTVPPDSTNYKDYAQIHTAFDTNVRQNTLVIADESHDTLLVGYITIAASAVQFSYLTDAPQAAHVGVYDNYLIAWSVREGSAGTGQYFKTRAQWSSRGDPGIWTGGNAGFEDLLDMRGFGTKVATLDNRLILFSTEQIWMGVPAVYPSQFQFVALDTSVGCPWPWTVADTSVGLVFLGTDARLRLLPKGGGLSQVVSSGVNDFLRANVEFNDTLTQHTWAWYDATRDLYRLFVVRNNTTIRVVLVVNVRTGEWGFDEYNTSLTRGCFASRMDRTDRAEALFAGNASGTLYSTSSILAQEAGSAVSSVFRSTPIGTDLPDGRRLVTGVNLNYRATSRSTGTVRLSGDFGNTFEAVGRVVSLTSAPAGNLVRVDTHVDGAAPVLEWRSQSTGYELHRAQVTMNLVGQP